MEVGNQLSGPTKTIGRAEALKIKGSRIEVARNEGSYRHRGGLSNNPRYTLYHNRSAFIIPMTIYSDSPQSRLLYSTNPGQAQVCQTVTRLLFWTSTPSSIAVLHPSLPRASAYRELCWSEHRYCHLSERRPKCPRLIHCSSRAIDITTMYRESMVRD